MKYKSNLDTEKKRRELDQSSKLLLVEIDINTVAGIYNAESADILSDLSGDLPKSIESRSSSSKGGRPAGTIIKAKEEK